MPGPDEGQHLPNPAISTVAPLVQPAMSRGSMTCGGSKGKSCRPRSRLGRAGNESSSAQSPARLTHRITSIPPRLAPEALNTARTGVRCGRRGPGAKRERRPPLSTRRSECTARQLLRGGPQQLRMIQAEDGTGHGEDRPSLTPWRGRFKDAAGKWHTVEAYEGHRADLDAVQRIATGFTRLH